jgi:hypothetical protein
MKAPILPRSLAGLLIAMAISGMGCGQRAAHEEVAVAPAATSQEATWTNYRDEANRFSVRYPGGWKRATVRLTPILADPREILSIGTSDLPPGGESCAQFPVNALNAVGATDALLTLQESGHPDLAGFPPLPDDLERLEPDTRFWGAGCLQNPNRLVTWWIRFRERDRAFYGLVAIGNSATEETRAQVFQALSSFQVEG